MQHYLDSVREYWQKGYDAENVESWVFRFYGRVLKQEMGIDGSTHPRLLDFGCGQGAAAGFFKSKGFDVYGVDISERDILVARKRMPDIAAHFEVIDSRPSRDDVFFGGNFDVVIAIQSLYYYNNTDLRTRLISLRNQMKMGGIIYASMMGAKSARFYQNSIDCGDGLRKVDFETKRMKVKDYYVSFVQDEAELLEKFGMFTKIHIGYYDMALQEDEGSDFHYTFIGKKA